MPSDPSSGVYDGSPDPPETPAAMLAHRVATDPASPLLTFYDDATGERTELSAATLANWVAKLANLFVEEAGLEPGDRLAVDLPAHWQTAAVLLAAWRARLVVGPDRGAALVCAEEGLPAAPPPGPAGGLVLALSLRPLGAGLGRPRPGVVDLAEEVPAYPDSFTGPAQLSSDPAWAQAGRLLTAGELAAAAHAPALPPRSRVLARTERWGDLAALVAGLLGPLASGGSAVVCRHLDPARLDDRIRQEQVTLLR
ncbi:MAG: TIGR03089 family protein [Mycobacteriales bacterium]